MNYWAVPDIVLDWKRSTEDLHKAVLTKLLLFNGPVILSDSGTASNYFLRLGLHRELKENGAKFYTELVENGYLLVANRTKGGDIVPLRKVEEGLLHSQGLSSDFPRFGTGEELDFLQQRAQILKFTLEGAADRYQREVFRLFQSDALSEAELPSNVRATLVEILEERVAASAGNDFVKWADFTKDSFVWRLLANRLALPDAYERYGNAVFVAARGPHVTFLPEQLKVDPTYSSEHQAAIDIWRERTEAEKKIVSQLRRSAPLLGPVDFRDGLALLGAEDIRALRDSSERIAFDEALRLTADNLSEVADVFSALVEYRMVIDSRIVQRGGQRATESHNIDASVSAVTIGKRLGEEVAIAAICNFVPALADSVTLGLFSKVHYVQNRVTEHKRVAAIQAAVTAARAEERKRISAEEVERQRVLQAIIDRGSPKIQLTIVSDRSAHRDGVLELT